jgi:sulfatase maturation enzyme AslB (radical SAM superfamily)
MSDHLYPQSPTGLKKPAGSSRSPRRFSDPHLTVSGQPRAKVTLEQLRTLWFNTGTLCNISCRNCFVESSPKNDRLAYLKRDDVLVFLDEIERDGWGTQEIGFTGGERFMNPDIIGMLEDSLSRQFQVLVLTNAMRPMRHHAARLLELKSRFPNQLTIRVSLDHFLPERHEEERGPGTFAPTLEGLVWLARNGFKVAVAGRTMWGEDIATAHAGFAELFQRHSIQIDLQNSAELVLFPEMDSDTEVPEITTACWGILNKSPADVMCSSSRMVVRCRGNDRPSVVACTLLPYDHRFELGAALSDAHGPVSLNHPHCSTFCVLGGASCSASKP